MIQPSTASSGKPSNSKIIDKLRSVLAECRQIKTELNSVKNQTFKMKRRMIGDIRFVRDSLKHSAKNTGIHNQSLGLDESNKENNINSSNVSNKFAKIEVGLQKQNKTREKTVVVNKNRQDVKQVHFSSELLLDMQEIRLLEKRQRLIGRRNERMSDYYSLNKMKSAINDNR